MPMTFTAPFAQTPKSLAVAVTAALGGLGTTSVTGAQLLVTAGTNGALVTRITAIPRATVTASSLLLFLVKSATPAVYQLIDSELMQSFTIATNTAIPETTFGNITENTPLRLEAGDMIYAASQVALAAGIVFSAQWMNY